MHTLDYVGFGHRFGNHEGDQRGIEGVALAIAKETNANVTGITLSENQIEYSNNKAKEKNTEEVLN